MINAKSMFDTKSGSRLMLAGVLLGTVALLGACSPTQTTRTTTTEETTSQQVAPAAPASTSVTTTKTQVYTPVP
jgi:uncharacterized lipoprotein YajG